MSPRLVLLPLLLTGACTWFKGKDRVLFTSDPPGARILIDGHDTGRTTPASIAIAGNFGHNHEITIQKRGYRAEQRVLYQHTDGYTSKWIDGAYDVAMPPLPFFWTPGDFLFPFAVRGAAVPAEMHVKLYPEGSPLLGFDVLAERARAGSTADDGVGAPR
jgi:hypothetical protein